MEPGTFKGDGDTLSGQAVSDLIVKLIETGSPAMIARLGLVELAVMSSAETELTLASALELLSGSALVRDIGINPSLMRSLCTLSGFFPADIEAGRRFVELMKKELAMIDVLGSWGRQESLFSAALSGAQKVRFRDLEPYLHSNPWSAALEGRTVLVIHPFAETIQSQYSRRAELFPGTRVLPSFRLETIKAVQSIAGTRTSFESWFEALEYMKRQVDQIQFDVAIIGCGAYGMPLAAHVKRIGKIAIHLGGQTQLMFGIRGKRWDSGHHRIQALFNEHWVYPAPADRPAGASKVENGAYW
jgi:hypothetical protein